MSEHNLYAIYDADGSVFGELAYLWGKCTGSAQCALCDLSHGWNPLGRRAWRQRGGLARSLNWVHRDELPDHVLNQVMDQLPCVVLDRDKRIEILVSRDALASCTMAILMRSRSCWSGRCRRYLTKQQSHNQGDATRQRATTVGTTPISTQDPPMGPSEYSDQSLCRQAAV